ncbi:MAG: tetratricopeptide repeat protein [Xanthomonadales bacterium]|nr:tetratricopeptide repeat protein [Xanthomonadales bacterium]
MAQIDRLSDELEAQPRNADLLLRRGDLHRRHLDHESASRDFARAARFQPDHPLLDLYRGRLALEMNDSRRAVRLLDRYASRNPEHALGWRLLGEALTARGEHAKAADRYRLAIEATDTPSPDLYRMQVLNLLASGAEDARPLAFSVIESGLDRFGVEVTLLGLGLDVALARGDLASARGLADSVPEALWSLPVWADRQALLHCLGAVSAKPACCQEAETRLEYIISEFHASWQHAAGP